MQRTDDLRALAMTAGAPQPRPAPGGTGSKGNGFGSVAWRLLVAGLVVAATVAIFVLAPTEKTMGHVQRIVYLHVAVAWLGLLGLLVMAGSGCLYLARRSLAWDHWFQAAGELGWICCGLTLATGSLWAHEAWGTWWEWEPRLTAAFMLWLVYSGILLIRSSLEDPHQRARVGAVLVLLGALDLPLIIMATRWFRGMHPVSPHMEPAMRLTLLVTVLAFTSLFATLVLCRRRQLQLRRQLDELTRDALA
jgi:heme exporter protein C